jgi:hypothetical protein
MILLANQNGQAVTAGVREKLTTGRTYYVRTDGNDNNSGLANTSNEAFGTINRAIQVVSRTLDVGAQQVIIQVGAGTYTSTVLIEPYVGLVPPIIRGDIITPANVVVSVTNNHCFLADSRSNSCWWNIEGFRVTCTGASSAGVLARDSSRLLMGNMQYGSCGQYQVLADLGSFIKFNANYSINGGAVAHWIANRCSSIEASSKTITLTGTPAFSGPFVYALSNSMISAFILTFSGSATGTRYQVTHNGTIRTGAGGGTYFPGSVAGTTATNGIYD